MDRFWNAPPVSRTIVAAMFVESVLVLSGLVDIQYVLFYTPLIFKFPLPELWRFVTSFLLTGGGFSFVFDLYFMWIYGTGLELNSPRFSQPGDFFTYVVFCATVIFLKRFLETRKSTPAARVAPSFANSVKDYMRCGYGGGGRFREVSVTHQFAATVLASYNPILTTAGFLLKAHIFTASLLLAFIYTFAQDNRGKKAHFVILQIPVEYLPWAMLTLTLIMGGPQAAMQQGTGVVAAHLYDFLTRLYPTFQGGSNWIQTPAPVKRYFGADRSSFAHKAYGTSFRPGQNLSPPQSRSWTSGFAPSSWSGRGQGRRLGGS